MPDNPIVAVIFLSGDKYLSYFFTWNPQLSLVCFSYCKDTNNKSTMQAQTKKN